jgi:hypothetical protein
MGIYFLCLRLRAPSGSVSRRGQDTALDAGLAMAWRRPPRAGVGTHFTHRAAEDRPDEVAKDESVVVSEARLDAIGEPSKGSGRY